MHHCTITSDIPFDHAHQLFTSDLAREYKRSKITLTNSRGKPTFTIVADDAVALRATITMVTSIVGTYEKTKKIIDDKH